ncbi:complex I NDUFA9 subunit family protein [Arenimonas fontis]|uniref:Complex I NDUFA9 subunit family protein n=1 Tax=Arenimonas fontis TaxID=2608255 RepID=A0A5B2Z7Q5_9GAMM|nr:complex I NDUFA9 subunit family protein [Arenimonas fontis]KAA2283999.1 complex I NDUFA9 subunit family protein [Arenimonas fontis]
MTPQTLVILGGTGFVGRHLVSRLARDGHRIVLLSRNLATHSDRLLPPGVELRELDVYDPTALQQAFAGADAVINLVGILNERGDNGRGFRRVHVELTKLVIAAMKLAGVRRLLQMSSLNAGRGHSHYLKSRGEAEAAVKASGLDWTIFEPSVIFGPGDGFFCRFAALLRLAPVLPLARARARFAPVYVGDVVEAFVRCLGNRASHGQVYELYGQETFTLAEIVRMTARQLGLRRWVLPLPDALGRLQGFVFDFVPGKPFSSDNFRSLLTDSVGGVDGLHRLGIEPTRVGAMLPAILGHATDKQSRYARYRSVR